MGNSKSINVRLEFRIRELQAAFPQLTTPELALAAAIKSEQMFNVTKIWGLHIDAKFQFELADLLEQRQNNDQRAWELAAESHSRYKRLVEIAVSPEFHAACVRRVKELEEKYPQLKIQL